MTNYQIDASGLWLSFPYHRAAASVHMEGCIFVVAGTTQMKLAAINLKGETVNCNQMGHYGRKLEQRQRMFCYFKQTLKRIIICTLVFEL